MRKWLWIGLFGLLGLLLGLGVVVFLLYRATQRVPQFYREALRVAPAVQEEASDQMIRRATALASDLKRGGSWKAVFTEEEINGWLAVDLVQNHPDLLPPQLTDPRVSIGPKEVILGCRLDQGRWASVVSLGVDIYLPEPNVIALRFHTARAGSLPVPLQTVLDQIAEQARQVDVQVRWRQAEGDPVVEVTVPPIRDQDKRNLRIEKLELSDGAIYISGSIRED